MSEHNLDPKDPLDTMKLGLWALFHCNWKEKRCSIFFCCYCCSLNRPSSLPLRLRLKFSICWTSHGWPLLILQVSARTSPSRTISDHPGLVSAVPRPCCPSFSVTWFISHYGLKLLIYCFTSLLSVLPLLSIRTARTLTVFSLVYNSIWRIKVLVSKHPGLYDIRK